MRVDVLELDKLHTNLCNNNEAPMALDSTQKKLLGHAKGLQM